MARIIRVLVLVAIVFSVFSSYASAQADKPKEKPKNHTNFFTIYVEKMNTSPMSFRKYPLQELTGTELDDFYRSPDGSISVTNAKFQKENKGAGIMLYPLGAKGKGETLLLSASYQTLPAITFTINSPAGQENYALLNGHTYNLGLGVLSEDRHNGWWALGAHSYLIGGMGKIVEPRGEGKCYFVEGGGGLTVGVIGVDVFLKVGKNYLEKPRPHSFFTAPIGLRATLTF